MPEGPKKTNERYEAKETVGKTVSASREREREREREFERENQKLMKPEKGSERKQDRDDLYLARDRRT